MTLDTQFKLKNNPLYIKYLHENSYWYKALNRDPEIFDSFVNDVRTNYKLRTTDKLNKALSTFEMISAIISSLNGN